jgi:hypothetical protein
VIPILNSNNNQKCYFLDANGYVFDESPYFSGNIYFRFYGSDDLDLGNPIGTYFLKNKFAKIVAFKDTLLGLDLNPTAFWLDSDGEGDFSIRGEPGIGPRIIFKIDDDYLKIAQNLEAAISTSPLESDLKTKLSSLLYLDLRFGNKVIYKFSAQSKPTSGGQ